MDFVQDQIHWHQGMNLMKLSSLIIAIGVADGTQ